MNYVNIKKIHNNYSPAIRSIIFLGYNKQEKFPFDNFRMEVVIDNKAGKKLTLENLKLGKNC